MSNRNLKGLYFIFLLITGLVLFQSCSVHKAAFEGTAWNRYNSDAATAYNQESFNEITELLKSTPATSLMAIQNGKVIYEYGDVEKVSYIASCRKSVLSMLFGKHVANGTIDLNATIGSLGIDEADGLLDREKQATVDHILTSRSGVHHVASNAGYDKESFLERGSVEPGTYFVYNNWDFNVAGHILEQYTGRSIYQELEDQLAKPLGFQDWNIKNQKKSGNTKKSQYKAYHIYISTRDMAKIGQLMLNEGAWKGEQLIPKEWVKRTTSTVTDLEEMIDRFGEPGPDAITFEYGYMWWLISNYRGNKAFEGAYTAIGYGGQFITVLPAIDMVVVLKTKLDLLTMIGIRYKETPGDDYWKVIDMLSKARK